MRVKIQQFLFGKSHSWSEVGKNIGKSLLKLGHDVEFISTDGIDPKFTPDDLKPYIKSGPTGKYDVQISYTAMINFRQYLANGDKNRFGIWAYEFNGKNVLPKGFNKNYIYTDKLMPPSKYCADIFKNAGIPEEKITIIPHGYNPEDFKNLDVYKLKTNKKYKICLIIGQNHRRKNLEGAFDAFGEAFNKNDDVCLVAKIYMGNNNKAQPFCVNAREIYNKFKKKFPNSAEVELITDFVPNIFELMNACDCNFTMSNCEGFYIPGLDAIALNKLNIVPNYGGQLDFLNEKNSLLINSEVVRAPRNYMYYSSSPYAEMCNPSIEHAVKLLKMAYNDHDELLKNFQEEINKVKNDLTWYNSTKKILNECQ